jgi:hypothetical protein
MNILKDKKPLFGRIKLVECDFFTMVLDCNGYAQPMSYCSAITMMKNLGLQLTERGKNEDGKDFEVWRLPTDRDTRNEDIDTRVNP